MGNTLRVHEDLVHVRGWSQEQIDSVLETLRRQGAGYSLTKEEFARYIGGRHRESITLFNDLDHDYDGKVDLFEVLTMLTLWSGTQWAAKEVLLFKLYDMMGKGFLKVDEVMLMGTVIVSVMRKFVKLDPRFDNVGTIRDIAHNAFAGGHKTLDMDDFRSWASGCDALSALRGFVEDHSARGLPDSKESRMRLQITMLEKHTSKLFERIEQLQDRLPDFIDSCIEYVSAWGRRKRWDFTSTNLRQLVLKMQQCAESMHTTLGDLSASLNEDEVSGGLSSVMDPQKRFSQEQMLLDVDVLRQQSLADFKEIANILRRLIELTEPNEMQAMTSVHDADSVLLNAIQEEEGEGLIDIAPPGVINNRNLMKQVHAELLKDIGEGGALAPVAGAPLTSGVPAIGDRGAHSASHLSLPGPNGEGASASPRGQGQASAKSLGSSAAATGKAAAPPEPAGPSLIAIASFEPPPSHTAQMLRLDVGEAITVVGQDGRGWWYGRKENGLEGWFPPSYVQVRASHFSSAGENAAPAN